MDILVRLSNRVNFSVLYNYETYRGPFPICTWLPTEGLSVPTNCWMYTQECHESLDEITEDEPDVVLVMGPAFAARCYEENADESNSEE
ncbi:hypothetical protein BDW59DRAFT_63769 [Aspergillus cavernicola]|uniref:Uncharacterized protein n=1 Tax=Aspergillus cavernicola TaxID=176166 RepID=A0ABR4J0Y8_9EURO